MKLIKKEAIDVMVKNFERAYENVDKELSLDEKRAVKEVYDESEMAKSQVESMIPKIGMMKTFVQGRNNVVRYVLDSEDDTVYIMCAANFNESITKDFKDFAKLNVSDYFINADFSDVKMAGMIITHMSLSSAMFNFMSASFNYAFFDRIALMFFTKEMLSIKNSGAFKAAAYDTYMTMTNEPLRIVEASRYYEMMMFKFFLTRDKRVDDNGSIEVSDEEEHAEVAFDEVKGLEVRKVGAAEKDQS